LKGELLLQQSSDNHAEAEHCFQQALDIARNQQAKSWELRAATSLARLWQQQGKRQEAHDLLAPVYHWFTEGLDTAGDVSQVLIPAQRDCPNSYRLMKSPITRSCMRSVLEKHSVRRTSRLIRVRRLMCLLSIFCVFSLPT